MNLTNPHPPHCPWHGLAESFGSPHIKYCEETICAWISEPANTWSNFAFFICAFILWKMTKGKDANLRFLPIAMAIMGAGSFIYHMSNTYLLQILDYLGMYVFVYWLMVLNLLRIGVSRPKAIWAYVGMCTLSLVIMHIMYTMQINYQLIVLGAALVVAATEVIAYKKATQAFKLKYFFMAIGLVVFAQICSIVDAKRIICDPTNHFIQGHALWHLFSAIGLTVALKHYEQFFPTREHQ